MTVRIFPIRHHGPGSARALGASLHDWQPDAVLVEGPPEADRVLAAAAWPGMHPPVALLAYLPAEPGRASFYPLAVWSPEWVAIHHALAAGVPVSMIDLPAAAMLRAKEEPAGNPDPGDAEPEPVRGDPIGRLAAAAGYDDPERWWDDVVEHRDGEEPWEALTEAMAELRADDPVPEGIEAQREASMRQHVRAAARRHERVAVVCGAWHAPVLLGGPTVKADRETLGGLPRDKATVTWVPWTNSRLAMASGYGAGVASPGWYEHLFTSPDRPIDRWMARVAGLLRGEDLDAPPASVVEAVRLAEALAAIRNRPLAGLAECTDAARAVLAGGSDRPLELIARRLVVGEVIGEVPDEVPTVPLAADVAAAQKRLRLRPTSGTKEIELDLRKDNDLARSHLLHRLGLLDVPWGLLGEARGTGTFREAWTLDWQPELAVRLIEASVHGVTLEAAATSRTRERAARAADVGEVTALVEGCLLADLPDAVAEVMTALDTRAAESADIGALMAALPPLVRVTRYGSVRRTDLDALRRVITGIVDRLCVGLAPAAASLDDTAAAAMTERVTAVSAALGALDDAALRRRWLDAVARLSVAPGLHGLLAGRTTRLAADAGLVSSDEVGIRLSAALSRGENPTHGAAWIEGLLASSGLLLVHDRDLLARVDEWLADVADDLFDDVLPLLRRSFSLFEAGERRMIGEAVTRLDGSGAAPRAAGGDLSVDEARGAAALPAILRLLAPGGTR